MNRRVYATVGILATRAGLSAPRPQPSSQK